MTIAFVAVALVIVLAIVVASLYRKSIERHNDNASSISALSNELNKRCDTITEDFVARDSATKTSLECLHKKADENAKRARTADEELSVRIDTLKQSTTIAINESKQQAKTEAQNVRQMAIQYADQKAEDVQKSVDELYDDLQAQIEVRMGELTLVLNSLQEENAQLRKELNEQKKKLDFYLNIREDAKNITQKEDVEKRTQALEAVTKAFNTRNQTSKAITEISQSSYAQDDEKIKGNEEKSLDHEQEFALDYMEKTKENLFITGKAGTGKSFLLDAFRMITKKAAIVLAPTGIAALNVNGVTLHSAFGYDNLVKLDINKITEAEIKLKKEKRDVLKRVETIIIDEISMVRADIFDKIDRILKVINQTNLPFGGKQMLVFGDLFQLPPVVKKEELRYLTDKYGGIFFFHSEAYKAGGFKFIELNINHRQEGDRAFFAILNRIREGKATNADISQLNDHFTPNEDKYDRYTTLLPTKEEVEQVNKTHIDQLGTKEFKYMAKTILDKYPTKHKTMESAFPINEELRLKVGAIVMMVANDTEKRWVNGTVGIVSGLSKDSIVVSLDTGEFELEPVEFDEQEITYVDGKISYETVYSVMQYPVVPAYAITIHKSQGQTYNNVMCDIGRCFANGQAYVALSRCASLQGLHLKSKITPASIKVDHDVLKFYREQLKDQILQ